jgi:hypothetical protein
MFDRPGPRVYLFAVSVGTVAPARRRRQASMAQKYVVTVTDAAQRRSVAGSGAEILADYPTA